jgi:hypothetical protein
VENDRPSLANGGRGGIGVSALAWSGQARERSVASRKEVRIMATWNP